MSKIVISLIEPCELFYDMKSPTKINYFVNHHDNRFFVLQSDIY